MRWLVLGGVWCSEVSLCWGREDNGGDCSGIDLAGVDRAYGSGAAFLALRPDGTGVCWGRLSVLGPGAVEQLSSEKAREGNPWRNAWGVGCRGMDFTGVIEVATNGMAFFARTATME